MDMYNYARYPKPEEWEQICKEKISSFNNLQLDISLKEKGIVELFGLDNTIELEYWIREFNNRIFDLITNYTLLKSYYDLGIPDEEWFISPGKNGHGISYFPHFEEHNFANLYWFSFYTESFLTRAEGIVDSIYHIVNVKFNINEPSKIGFRKAVLKKLEAIDKNLFDYLEDIPNNSKFKKMNEYRNTMVHNFRINQITSGITKETLDDGTIMVSMGVGNYTTSAEFLDVVHDSIDLLLEIKEKVAESFK